MDKQLKRIIDSILAMSDEEKAKNVARMMYEEGEDAFYGDDEEEGYYDDYEGDIPEGCLACGGPFPDCMSSCNLFDD